MSYDWNARRFTAKDAVIVALVALMAGVVLGELSSQRSYDEGFRRAVVHTSPTPFSPDQETEISNAQAVANAAAIDAAMAAGEAARASSSYAVIPARSHSGENFRGYPCTDDCSGHEAGYAWAEENGITDPDICDGNSDSFVEGCIAWAEEN